MKRILVIYASYGTGHKSIAEYVYKYLKENRLDANIMLLNLSDYGNRIGRIGNKLFAFVAKNRQAKLFNFCYELMDHKIATITHNKITVKSFDNKKLREVITNFNPDITVSSHFYGSDIVTYYNKLGITNSKIMTIITDYAPHECWIKNHKIEDAFIVGNEIVKEELIKRGVEAKKIYPYGLPINISSLKKIDDTDVILKRYNLENDKKIYLFFGGSSTGSMYYYDYLKALIKLKINANIIFICGKNEKLKVKSDALIKKHDVKNIKVYGYSNDVLNLMKISDLVITKPGGATVTECLEMRTPMLLVPGIGGQEKYNARFVVKKRYGIKVRGPFGFKRCLLTLEKFPFIIDKMRERMRKMDDNKSVEKINKLINKL